MSTLTDNGLSEENRVLLEKDGGWLIEGFAPEGLGMVTMVDLNRIMNAARSQGRSEGRGDTGLALAALELLVVTVAMDDAQKATECEALIKPFLASVPPFAETETWEQAALICERVAQGFLSEEYAVGQPLSSISERFACKECALAIRTVASESATGGSNQKPLHPQPNRGGER